jgi:glucose/arabinose dehydrogenase
MAVRAGDGALYFAEKGGGVRALRGGQVDPTPVLDLTGQVATGGEQGLLGLAFSPDGTHLYVNYTDTAGDTHVTEFAMAGGQASGPSRRDVLVVHQPYANHNGGNLVFGPDGLLWIGLGDGGSEDDPQNYSQNDGTLLGKMVRLDPRPGGQPTTWAKGLRNPWRYSFDKANGDLWIADVGGNAWEEIDFTPAATPGGLNYGWSRYEGSHLHNPSVSAPAAVTPIFEYPHGGGVCAVTGGYVYRGSRIAGLGGAYLYADFCVGQVSALAQSGSRLVAQRQLGLHASNLSSFGEDQAGELYVLSLNGPVYRIDPA